MFQLVVQHDVFSLQPLAFLVRLRKLFEIFIKWVRVGIVELVLELFDLFGL